MGKYKGCDAGCLEGLIECGVSIDEAPVNGRNYKVLRVANSCGKFATAEWSKSGNCLLETPEVEVFVMMSMSGLEERP